MAEQPRQWQIKASEETGVRQSYPRVSRRPSRPLPFALDKLTREKLLEMMMPERNPACPKCSAKMELGFMPDATYGMPDAT